MFFFNGVEIDITQWQCIGESQCSPDYLADPIARAELGIIEVDATPPFCQAHQRAVRGALIQSDDGSWRFTWSLVDLTAEELAARDARAAQELADLTHRLVARVDDRLAGIYERWERFKSEYAGREQAARAILAGSYDGDPDDEDDWVGAFARAAGITATAAAALIVSQADGLYMALKKLGALRMKKLGIERAGSAAAAQAVYEGIILQAGLIEAGLK